MGQKARQARLILIAVATVLLAIILTQNAGWGQVELLFWQVRMPRIVLLLVILLVGFALGLLAASMLMRRRKRQ